MVPEGRQGRGRTRLHRRHRAERARVDRRQVRRVRRPRAAQDDVAEPVHHRGGAGDVRSTEEVGVGRGVATFRGRARSDPQVPAGGIAGIGSLRRVVRRGEPGQAHPQPDDQRHHDRPGADRPRTAPHAAADQARQDPAEGRRGHRPAPAPHPAGRPAEQPAEQPADHPAGQQAAGQPGGDRQHQQRQVELHAASHVDRSGPPVEGVGTQRDDRRDDQHDGADQVQPLPTPERSPLRQPRPVLLDLPVDGPPTGDVQGHPGGQEATQRADRRGGQQRSGAGPGQRSPSEHLDRRQVAGGEPEQRPGRGEQCGAQREHPQQVPATGAPDPEDRLLATLRLRQHVAGVPGEDSGEQPARHPEEDEETLGGGRVPGRHRQRVRDVVEQVVLLGRDRHHRRRDRAGLGDGGRRVGVQPIAVQGDVDLAQRRALQPAVPPSHRPLVGREDLVGEQSWRDHHRGAGVDEGLQVPTPPAGEERPGSGEVRHPGHLEIEPGVVGQGHTDGVPRPDPECRGGLRADHGAGLAQRAVDEVDAVGVSGVVRVEPEDLRLAERGPRGSADRVRAQVRQRELAGAGHAGDLGDPGRQLRQPGRRRPIGRDRADRLPRGVRRRHRGRVRRQVHGRADGVPEAVDLPRCEGAQVVAGATRPGGQRAELGIGHRVAVQPRRPGEVLQLRCRDRADGHLVGRQSPGVGDLDQHPDAVPRRRTLRPLEPLGQSQAARCALGDDALHVQGQRGNRPLGHRGRQPVDEEQHAAEQADPQAHPDHRGQRPAGVAQQVGEHVPSEHRRLLPTPRAALSACGAPARGPGPRAAPPRGRG